MKTVLTLTSFIMFFSSFGQEVINERYDLNYGITIFGNVIATDSCYYVTGIAANLVNKGEASFIRFNFDGTIHSSSFISSDSLHLDIWESTNLTKTLDHNFVQTGYTLNNNTNSEIFTFYKFKPNGDTLFTTQIDEFNNIDGNNALWPSHILVNADSSFTCLVNTQNPNTYISSATLFKLNKTGQLLWYKYFSGIATNNYNLLLAKSLLKYDTNKLIIGGTLTEQTFVNENKRMHTKLIMVDTLGNIIQQRTYWEDTLNYTVNGLTKTIDGGLLYCGKYGWYFEYQNGVYSNAIKYKGQITKLDANFDLEWRVTLDKFGSENYGLNNLITLNDSEFVAVGNSFSYGENGMPYGKTGWLVKFNINGEILWERKYTKVPHFDGENNWATHILYDVDVTKDSGFVMVGQSTNYYTDNGVPSGQQGWLVKVDKHGCLVPNCQQYDNIDTTNTGTTDTVLVVVSEPVELYPNPANSSLYYYHTQTDTSDAYQPSTAYIYDMSGETVQKWLLNDNNITYIIDVANFESGTYVLKVISNNGNALRTKKFVVLH